MERLKELLLKNFGYSSFRDGQYEIIENLLKGRDGLVIMPTGGGKSLCYQLPALYLEGTAIVVSPLISLMEDQVRSLQQNGIAAGYLNSSLPPQERRDLSQRLRKGEVSLCYLAPEGLFHPQTLELLNDIQISFFAIDEAHCVSQWGHEFRPDYRRLAEVKKQFPKTPTIALTATADAKTRDDIVVQLALDEPEIFISGFDRPNIRYMIHERRDEIAQLHEFLKSHHEGDTGIVYCLSRNKVETVAERLCELGYNAVAYHAGLSPKQRRSNQKRFDSEEGIVVVATIAFGMGIDRPDVRFVAHLDLPKSVEGYYQETGRAGRDGNPANAWMAYGLGDVVKLAQMIEMTDADERYKKVARRKLDQMLLLCETTDCRRQVLLQYFGDKLADPCGNCDSCLEPAELWDATVPAQKILSTIYRTGQFFGTNYVIDVVRGSKNAKVLERGHDKLSVYGIGKDLSKEDWNAILRQLLYMEYVMIKSWDYRNLALTEKARPLLTGQETLRLRRLRNHKVRVKKQKVVMEHGRDDLFERLRGRRKELASELGVPPYVVFSDKTLHEMCTFLPRNEEEMLLVNGVGESKLEKYGQDFLSIVSNYAEPV